MNQKPLVSVCMISYNHESYIAQAIESILAQKTDFTFELIIGEDSSPDKTREICLSYQKRFPDIIKVLNRAKNLGMMPNFIDSLNNCQGKYIAICEGDDYWTDPGKLQKQVEFLETNLDFTVCFHGIKALKEGEGEVPIFTGSNVKEVSTFDDLALENYIPTVSCMFRNNLFEDSLDWFAKSEVGDYPLHLLNAQYGKIKFFSEVMAVYRVHEGGAWSLKKQKQQLEIWLKVIELCYNHFYPQGSDNFEKQMAETLSELCFIHFNENQYAEFRRYFNRLIKWKKHSKSRTMLALTIRFVLSYQRKMAELYKNLTKPSPINQSNDKSLQ